MIRNQFLARTGMTVARRLSLGALRRNLIDISRGSATLGAALICSVIPTSADRFVARKIYSVFRRTRRVTVRQTESRMNLWLAGEDKPLPDAREKALNYHRMRIEVRWTRARAISQRPSTPETIIVGIEHLEQALRNGQGAILWRMSFTCAAPLNAALAGFGHPLTHLSASDHLIRGESGLSQSVFAPINRFDEERFLERRIEIPQLGTINRAYQIELQKTLESNRVVSIVGDLVRSRQAVDVAVGNHSLPVPTGAPSLAFKTGATLLPCAAIRIAPFSYKVILLAWCKTRQARFKTRLQRTRHRALLQHFARVDQEIPGQLCALGHMAVTD